MFKFFKQVPQTAKFITDNKLNAKKQPPTWPSINFEEKWVTTNTSKLYD